VLCVGCDKNVDIKFSAHDAFGMVCMVGFLSLERNNMDVNECENYITSHSFGHKLKYC
jgi:hypothetical protein